MNKGKIVWEGASETLVADEEIKHQPGLSLVTHRCVEGSVIPVRKTFESQTLQLRRASAQGDRTCLTDYRVVYAVKFVTTCTRRGVRVIEATISNLNGYANSN